MILSRWKSGPLPKPMKILPTVPNWERIIEVAQPESWTPNAIYGLTRIFASAKPAVVQRWLEIVVLPRVRDEIYETKKLYVHFGGISVPHQTQVIVSYPTRQLLTPDTAGMSISTTPSRRVCTSHPPSSRASCFPLSVLGHARCARLTLFPPSWPASPFLFYTPQQD